MLRFSEFLSDERGSPTIEFVLWMPLITTLTIVVIDASTLYLTHSDMWIIARDTARRMTMQGNAELTPEQEQILIDGAVFYASHRISQHNFVYNVSASFIDHTAAEVVIRIDILGKSLLAYALPEGLVEMAFPGGTMQARVVMRQH